MVSGRLVQISQKLVKHFARFHDCPKCLFLILRLSSLPTQARGLTDVISRLLLQELITAAQPIHFKFKLGGIIHHDLKLSLFGRGCVWCQHLIVSLSHVRSEWYAGNVSQVPFASQVEALRSTSSTRWSFLHSIGVSLRVENQAIARVHPSRSILLRFQHRLRRRRVQTTIVRSVRVKHNQLEVAARIANLVP